MVKHFIKRSGSIFSHSSFNYKEMRVFGVCIPDKPLADIELSKYAQELEIPLFRGVFMRDTFPLYPFNVECGIVSLNTSNQAGSHLVCYNRNKTD